MARAALLSFLLVALFLSARAQLQDPGCPGLPTPCGGLARGVCFAANASTPPTCQCTAGWTGADCTTPDCPGGCPANAYCEPLLNPPACLCNASLNATGPDCAQVDLGCPGEPDCTDNVTNGICNTTTSQCMCLPGWTGPACNVPALCPLGPNNFTCTGNGDCVPNDVGFFYCRCYIGWLGKACEGSVCDPVAGRNCSWPNGQCTLKYPPRCECLVRRKGGQMCDKTDQTKDFDLSPIGKPAAFGIAVSLAFLAFLVLGIVVYLERTRFQCLTKQEREEDAAYAKLEAARKLADQAPRKRAEEQAGADKSGSTVATDASGSAAGSTAALVVKDKQRVVDDDDDDGGL